MKRAAFWGALLVLGGLIALAVVYWQQLFGPGTWGSGGNLFAWALCGTVAAVVTYLLRDQIGPVLAKWWNGHAGNGFSDEIDSLKKHVSAELHGHHIAIHDRLSQQDELIRTAATVTSKPKND